MGLVSLHSSPSMALVTRPCSSARRRRMDSKERPASLSSHSSTIPLISSRIMRSPDARTSDFQLRASVSSQDTSGSNLKSAEALEQGVSKDTDVVFVAGATGRVGSRTVRELLKLGFRVRAGARSVQRAEMLVQSVQQMKLDGLTGSAGSEPGKRLEIVVCDLENRGVIGPAIGSASIVICCIGASEKEVFDVTGPYRIDYLATKNLIESATFAKVDHFILLTSLGTNKIGFPAAILNLFWGVLIWKRKSEELLIGSGLPYTIVRPGGMERPTDSYKETHNLVLSNEDTLFGGQVSNLQVAELMAIMAKNKRISLYKVVEVIAETIAPLTPMEELLARIPAQRELPAEPQPDPPSLTITSGPTKEVMEEEPSQMEVVKGRSLSPYAVYEDLKPPTSPTPTPSTTPYSLKGKPEELQAKAMSTATTESRITAVTEKDNIEVPAEKPRPLSPYTAYEDLKPPTSPSTKAPVTVLSVSTPVDGGSIKSSISETSTADEQKKESHVNEKKARPQSPFTMYEELKPPTSPLPSVPR